MRVDRLLILVCLLVILALLASCGQHFAPGAAGAPTSVITPTPTARPSLSPSPSLTTTTTVTGTVTLTLGAASYHPNEVISVILSNRSTRTIFFPDHLTYCTVIQLQQWVNGNWASVSLCRLEIVTRLHELHAGQSLVVQLFPPPGQWTPGLYRAALGYVTVSITGQRSTIHSAEFQVGQDVGGVDLVVAGGISMCNPLTYPRIAQRD
jgi:hypothetical protein